MRNIIFTPQVVQIVLLAIAFLMMVWIVFKKLTKPRFMKSLILKNIANSAYLPNNSMLIDAKYASEQYQPLYLIHYNDYDLETIEHQSSGFKNRVYQAKTINGNEYVIVNTNDRDLIADQPLAIEDNYTKAIFIVEPSAEYFYIDILFPKKDQVYRVKSRHNIDNNKRRLSRDELKHFRIIGRIVSLVKDY